MSRVTQLDRRTLLRGTGALVALPFLEAMTARTGLALGAREEALKAGAVLGRNYPGTIWYKHSYELLRRHQPRT